MHELLLDLHVVVGTVGLAVGPFLLYLERHIGGAREGPRRRVATAYRVAVALVCASAVVLIAGWRADLWWLVPVAGLSAALAEVGLRAAARPIPYRAAALTHGLGGSYIALFTAFVVVELTVDGALRGAVVLVPWLVPTVIGTVLIERWRLRLARVTCET